MRRFYRRRGRGPVPRNDAVACANDPIVILAGMTGREASPSCFVPRIPDPNPALRYPSPMRKDPIEQLLRALYSAALYLLVPVTVYPLIWRGFRPPDSFQRWNAGSAERRGGKEGVRTV